MKLKGLSLVLPLADLRPLCAPASRLHFLSPFTAKPAYTYLKGFGLCKERKLRIPWRPVETIFFECNRAVSLPQWLPDGARVTRVMRRAYLDDRVAVRFDFSIFTNPLHREPASVGTVDEWTRVFWETPLSIRSNPIQEVTCPTVLYQLASRFTAASTFGPDVRTDLVECLSPLVISVVQASKSELSEEYIPFDRKPSLFCRTRSLQLSRLPDSTPTLCLAHLPTEYFRPRDAAFQQLRWARSYVAWLHTELQVLASLTRRLHAVPAESELILRTVEVLVDSLLAASQRAESSGLHIRALEGLFLNTRTRIAESLVNLGLLECAAKLEAALPTQEPAYQSRAGTRPITAAHGGRTASPQPSSLDELLETALTLFAKSVTGDVQPSPARYDDIVFRESARRKAQEVFLRLPASCYRRPPVIVSLGGADGTELFELLERTGSRHGVLLEFADRSTESARAQGAKRNVSVSILTGDAMQKLKEAMETARRMAAELADAPIIVTMMAILHELPTRSPNFDYLDFFTQLASAAVIIGREPVEPGNWSTEVLLSGNFSAQKFAHLASIVTSKVLKPEDLGYGSRRVAPVSSACVRGHRALVLETLVKALYPNDILYELQERFTTIREDKLLRTLGVCFGSTHHVSSEPLTSISISSSWRRFGLTASACDDHRPLGKPASHIWYEVIQKQLLDGVI